jgi:ubiquinone biosynthesis protein COQ9
LWCFFALVKGGYNHEKNIAAGNFNHYAASFAFATIVTRKLEVELELQGEKWVVANENVLDENFSTYGDRKYGKQDTQ